MTMSDVTLRTLNCFSNSVHLIVMLLFELFVTLSSLDVLECNHHVLFHFAQLHNKSQHLSSMKTFDNMYKTL